MAVTIRVVHTVTWDPPEVAGGIANLENGTQIYLHGSGVPVLNNIFESLNWSVTNTYLDFLSAMSSVYSNISDIGSLLISHTTDWETRGIGSTLVYLHPLTREASIAFFRQPASASFTTTMIHPFQLELWAIIFLAFLTLASLSFFTAQKEKRLNVHALCTLVFHLIELIVARQSFSVNLTSIRTRFVTSVRLVAVVLSVFITSVYTAKIVTAFVFENKVIKSPVDLLEHQYTIYSYSELHIDKLFTNPLLEDKVHQKVQPVQGLQTIADVIGKPDSDPRKAILSLPDGFFPQAIYGLGFTYEICKISIFESSVKTPRCPYIRKGSPYRNTLNIRILLFIERGLNFRLQAQSQRKYIFKCSDYTNPVTSISLKQVSFALYLFVIGAALATLLHFVNICWHSKSGIMYHI